MYFPPCFRIFRRKIPCRCLLSGFSLSYVPLFFTGIGAAASLNMRLIPNPGDGIVQAIALGFLFTGKLQGVGIGTVLAVIGVGRSIAVFNHFAQDRMKKLADIRD